uniref:Uncharacterized protein n=1 Tax=Arundo donax TaxID=35708 RepID=A0A0A8Y188_ARUDO
MIELTSEFSIPIVLVSPILMWRNAIILILTDTFSFNQILRS